MAGERASVGHEGKFRLIDHRRKTAEGDLIGQIKSLEEVGGLVQVALVAAVDGRIVGERDALEFKRTQDRIDLVDKLDRQIRQIACVQNREEAPGHERQRIEMLVDMGPHLGEVAFEKRLLKTRVLEAPKGLELETSITIGEGLVGFERDKAQKRLIGQAQNFIMQGVLGSLLVGFQKIAAQED